MKKLLVMFSLIFLPQILWAASTTVEPFSFEFTTPVNRFEVQAEVIQNCRYEKLVLGDSSEYHSETKIYELRMDQNTVGADIHYKFALPAKKSLKVSGMFKPTKECKSDLKLTFTDKNYAIGWAGQLSRPISFTYETNEKYQNGNTSPDFSYLIITIEHQYLDFFYKSALIQVNIWLTASGENLPVSPVSAAINPLTRMPFQLRK